MLGGSSFLLTATWCDFVRTPGVHVQERTLWPVSGAHSSIAELERGSGC